jgi:hypothetical protein
LTEVFYSGTFKVTASGWEDIMREDLSGTLRILLNLIWDVVIKRRWVSSDFSYPNCIVDMLLKLVVCMVNADDNAQSYIDDTVEQLRSVDPRNMNRDLRNKILEAFGYPPS